ncbi:hypothetical protein G6F59_017074 [Rhizopus arrhizus]|nr:hypothetical protein G6F59_017074 [Rhizopus arrhizus]
MPRFGSVADALRAPNSRVKAAIVNANQNDMSRCAPAGAKRSPSNAPSPWLTAFSCSAIRATTRSAMVALLCCLARRPSRTRKGRPKAKISDFAACASSSPWPPMCRPTPAPSGCSATICCTSRMAAPRSMSRRLADTTATRV